MRLHELAKELGVTSKELLAQVREIGLNVKSHSSNLEAGEESLLRYAMKEIVEERRRKAEEEAQKKAAKKKKKKKAARKKTAAKKKDGGKGEKEEEEKAAAEEESGAAVAVIEGEEEAPLPAAAEGAAAPEEAETAPPAEAGETAGEEPAGKEPAGKEEDAKGKTPLKKLRKVVRKKPTATILGRIELPSETLEAHRKARERKKEEPGPKRKSAEKTKDLELPRSPVSRVPKPARPKEEPEPDEKVRRVIKPKQKAFDYVDVEDDPLLQGIRISHWDKYYKRRRPVFRHGRGQKKSRRPQPPPDWKVDVEVPISLKELSQLMGIKAQDIMMALLRKGTMVHINSTLDEEAVLQVALEFNREIGIVQKKDEEELFLEEVLASGGDAAEKVLPRPPIVTLLGHVDHGKTSLLDAIRKSDVVSTEEGGITQHISAYQVRTPSGNTITFLDTPGHKAFTEMRARGAHATDIVVLVVAGDDGVMPQTEEAVQHAKAAGVPIVVAVNKMDKPGANSQRVKQQLAGLEVMTEDWGGEVGCVEVSAVTGAGLDELLERIVLEAEVLELASAPDAPARGVVLESRKDEEVGNIVTLLVTDGTLKLRDTLLAGESVCRVRVITDDKGRKIAEAGPSMPVNVTGFELLPDSGERFNVVTGLDRAREIAALRKTRSRERRLTPERKTITLENLFESLEAGKVTEIDLVVKADVKGSLEVLRKSFEEMQHEEVKLKVIRGGVGGVTEEDVLLAIASNAIILGFRVTPDVKARKLIEENDVDFRSYRVIYELLEDLRLAMEGALKPVEKEDVTGHLEIRQVFKSSRIGNIAGCFVTDGVIKRSSKVRLVREGVIVHEGEIETLKRFKDDQREVREGYECGVKIAGYDDIKVGDRIEAFEIVEVKRTLEQAKEPGANSHEPAGPRNSQ